MKAKINLTDYTIALVYPEQEQSEICCQMQRYYIQWVLRLLWTQWEQEGTTALAQEIVNTTRQEISQND